MQWGSQRGHGALVSIVTTSPSHCGMNKPAFSRSWVRCSAQEGFMSPFQPRSLLDTFRSYPWHSCTNTFHRTVSAGHHVPAHTSSFLAEALTPESARLPPALATCGCIGHCPPTRRFLRNCILLWFPCNAWARRQHQLGFEGVLSGEGLSLWFLIPASVEGPAAEG